jgi:hypothetical protein
MSRERVRYFLIVPVFFLLFDRLNLEQGQWLGQVKAYGSHYYRAVGHLNKLKQLAASLGQQWVKGLSAAKHLYQTPG